MKERWDLNRRAVRLLCHLDRKYFLCTLFSSLTTAIAPYIPIYFSAKIIDALTAGAGGKTLALYAALTVGMAALIGLAGALLKMHADVGEAELDRLVDWKHAEKAMDLPYALIEDRKTALLRERIEMETQTGYNVYYYAVTAGGLVRYAVQIAAAVLLTFSLFRPGLLSAGAKLALLAGIVLTAAVSVLTGRRYGRLRSEFFAGCVDDNIRGEKLYDYTSNDSSGKDIRLYGMRAALLQKERDFNENFCRRERTMNFGVAWMGLLSNLDEAAKIQAPKAMKEIYSFYKEYRGRDLDDADWKELTEKARQICAGWEENEWVRRIVLEMISLLDSDDAERRRIALEVEKEMEAAEQKMNAA